MDTDRPLTAVAIIDRDYLVSIAGVRDPVPFRIEYGAFIYVTGGGGVISVNLTEYGIGERDFVTIIPGSMVHLPDISDDFTAYVIIFSGGFTRDLDLWKSTLYSLVDILENPVLKISSGENATLVNSYCAMLHEIHTKHNITFKAEIMKNMLEAVMFAISGFYRDLYSSGQDRKNSGKISRNHEITKDFLGLVAEHYEREREVSFYAGKLCVTPKHLGYVVKSVYGEPASEAIAKAVIMDAKSKLKSTDMSVRQISDSLNFPNPSFFCKYFKKHVGLTPKAYRMSVTDTVEEFTFQTT